MKNGIFKFCFMVLDLILNSFSILNLKGIGASLSSNATTRTLFEFQQL
ncbi:hypothetical protein HMPREF1420_01667 [Helicobacter pylori GAM264Ai]|nr:hypothetical protein HMPREF1420_01667 [Helicobacter pylori GAM264Ai]EMH45244.1 hypothetical protein HMPREF1430_00056 [Helicobacter pylori GAM96Ai]EMJ43779.1 hypothetical protein HMPREF1434_00868 [Helicobacter pylori GAMchJs124i]